MLSQLRRFDISKAIKNFPISIVAAIVVSSSLGYIVAQDPYSKEVFNTFLKIGISAFFVFLIAINAELIGGGNKKSRLIGNVLSVASGVVIFCLLPDNIESSGLSTYRLPYQLIGSGIILHLLVSYMPFRSSVSQEDFWEYNKELFIRFVESTFYAVFLFGSLSIAILAVDKLFGLSVDSNTYVYLFIFLVGIFHPIYFLSRFPDFNYDGKIKPPARAFMVFSQYILIPVVAIYMLILYAYGGKILTQWSLPKGWVSQLSLWFSVTGIFTYLLNRFNHLFSDFALNRLFQRFLFPALLIPILLIFVAIRRRIVDYGYTEERYIVLFLGIWLVIMWLYFSFSREKNIKYLPASLAVLIGISLFTGPVNMFNASIESQKNRLFSHLEKVGKFQSGKVINIDMDYSEADRQSLTGIIDALERRSDMRFLNQHLSEPLIFAESTDSGSKIGNSNADVVMARLGIKRLYSLQVNDQGYFSAYAKRSESIDITGYDQLRYFPIYHMDSLQSSSPSIEFDLEDISIKVGANDSIHSESFASLVSEIAKLNEHQQQKKLKKSLEFDAMGFKFKVFFQGLSGKIENKAIKLDHVEGVVLIGS